MVHIQRFDHIGIRVADAKRSLEFYRLLGFEVLAEVDFDDVTILKNENGVELNLIHNANDINDGKNILMDMDKKFAGFTHLALRVASIKESIVSLKEHNVPITQGPVSFGDGHISVFIRDPDRNVIELRGREQDLSDIGGVTFYEP